MQVGTTKDQGLYSKPSVAVHPGALAAGTLPQYNRYIKTLKHYVSEDGSAFVFRPEASNLLDLLDQAIPSHWALTSVGSS